jgi:hypothetical protein
MEAPFILWLGWQQFEFSWSRTSFRGDERSSPLQALIAWQRRVRRLADFPPGDKPLDQKLSICRGC